MSTTRASDRIKEFQNRIERRLQAAAIIEAASKDAGCPITADSEKIEVSSRCVHETTGSRLVSEALWDFMYPREPGGEFFHYTGEQALESILKNRTLWLVHLLKRIDEDELSTHAAQHGWTGYTDASNEPAYINTLAKDLFYLSMTPTTALNERRMWSDFAAGGTGARLRLRVDIDSNLQHAELRKIGYVQEGTKTLLNEINEQLKVGGLPEFLPWASSKIGAFCLPSPSYGGEYEVRLLYKFHHDPALAGQNDPRDHRKSNGVFEYWELPLEQPNSVASVRLIGIEAGPSADMKAIRAAVAKSAYSRIVPVQVP